jgi:hypothetical protein
MNYTHLFRGLSEWQLYCTEYKLADLESDTFNVKSHQSIRDVNIFELRETKIKFPATREIRSTGCYLWLFLGAFEKFRKTTISFVMSVCLEQLSSYWTASDKISYWRLFQKSVEKIQVLLTSDKNNGYFTRRRFHIYDNISLNYS